ncbi:hypothetical protein NHJ13734_003244 [Beauveria thailandica]
MARSSGFHACTGLWSWIPAVLHASASPYAVRKKDNNYYLAIVIRSPVHAPIHWPQSYASPANTLVAGFLMDHDGQFPETY